MMQLIIESETSGDIQTNMSMEIDSAINGDIKELKNDLVQSKKENDVVKKDESKEDFHKSLTVELNDQSDDNVIHLNTKISLETNTNGNAVSNNEGVDFEKVSNNSILANADKEMELKLNLSEVEAMDVDMETNSDIENNSCDQIQAVLPTVIKNSVNLVENTNVGQKLLPIDNISPVNENNDTQLEDTNLISVNNNKQTEITNSNSQIDDESVSNESNLSMKNVDKSHEVVKKTEKLLSLEEREPSNVNIRKDTISNSLSESGEPTLQEDNIILADAISKDEHAQVSEKKPKDDITRNESSQIYKSENTKTLNDAVEFDDAAQKVTEVISNEDGSKESTSKDTSVICASSGEEKLNQNECSSDNICSDLSKEKPVLIDGAMDDACLKRGEMNGTIDGDQVDKPASITETDKLSLSEISQDLLNKGLETNNAGTPETTVVVQDPLINSQESLQDNHSLSSSAKCNNMASISELKENLETNSKESILNHSTEKGSIVTSTNKSSIDISTNVLSDIEYSAVATKDKVTIVQNVSVSSSDDSFQGDDKLLPESKEDSRDHTSLCEINVNAGDNGEAKPDINKDSTGQKDLSVSESQLKNTNIDDTLIESKTKNKLLESAVDVSINETLEDMEVEENLDSKKNNDNTISNECVDLDQDDVTETPVEKILPTSDTSQVEKSSNMDSKSVEVIDDEDIKIIEDEDSSKDKEENKTAEATIEPATEKKLPVVCKLSNTLDILSDDEEESSKIEPAQDNDKEKDIPDKQCIDIDDDDDIMFIEYDTGSKKSPDINENKSTDASETQVISSTKTDEKTNEKEVIPIDINELSPTINEKVSSPAQQEIAENKAEEKIEKPLLSPGILRTAKKKLGDMTRDELEDFCIMKIVESLVDRTGLGEIKNKMKEMSRNLEEYKKKAMALSKQNMDLQVVLKSVQEEQKKRARTVITPLKITRSVGMQVLMTDKLSVRRQGPIPSQPQVRPVRAAQQKAPNIPSKPQGNIPFPRLVPANNTAAAKTPVSTPVKAASPTVKNPSPVPKPPEKRPLPRTNSSSAFTVDLTDDEPPAKVKAKGQPNPIPPVRLVSPQALLQQKVQQALPQNHSSPRKVYIPISGSQGQAVRPGQTLMLKSIPTGPSSGPKSRTPVTTNRPKFFDSTPSTLKMRHPAPLPDAMKQYTPPTWKPLPPAPDLKLSKVENGIVISWKIDGIPESSFETIASYQLYAYQETSSPPSTSLWKKIGDVKALPLPMACTLTQFMAGFKYYFAVRAVDIRSRLGPFSVPGSILLLSKA